MLRYKDFESEVKKMQDKAKADKLTLDDVVKGIELLGKFLRDVRSNQVRVMDKLGVDLRTPEARKGDEKPKTGEETAK